MKKQLYFTGLILVFPLLLKAQLGDFGLNGNRRTVVRAADSAYRGGPIKNMFIGRNYRQEWLQRIRVPIIDLKTDFGGLIPEKEGGGKQTRSLQLKDAEGKEWVLRSVRKYPEKATPPEIKGTLGEKILNDALSASFPYATLSTGTLAKAAGVPYLPNTLVYIPNDPALKEFREKFRNSMAFLELRTVMSGSEKLKTHNTYEIIPKLQKSAKGQVDQLSVLRARILDNFIMDFDRHEDQWMWAEKDSIGRTFYSVIPKDRDQAFFLLNGLLHLATVNPSLGPVQGFRPRAKDINTFNYSARDFDRRFLSEPDEVIWQREVDRFLATMTDAVIDEAFSKQPKEIQNISNDDIADALKKRRKYFNAEMMAYYRFLSRTVSVTGSNHSEQFTITKNTDGTVVVTSEVAAKDGRPAYQAYKRVFDPEVTDEIRIYGLEDDDKFIVQGGSNPIKIRLVGGPGKDSFINEGGDGGVMLYDVSFEDNEVRGGFRNKINDDPLNNEYRFKGTVYNSVRPGMFIELSKDGGLFLGPRLRVITQGFRKDPYGSKHVVLGTRSINGDFYHFRYDADFIGRKADILVRGDYRLPTVRTNFFGFGNNTTYNNNIPESAFRARYSLADVALLVNNKITSALQFKVGPVLQYFKLDNEQNIGKYIASVYPNTGSTRSLYEGLWYAGGEARLELNAPNDLLIPSRGLRYHLYGRPLFNLSNAGGAVVQLGSELSFYSDFLLKDKIVLAMSFGGSHNVGEFGIPQAQYLGFKQNLRGYRFQRFAGRSRAYNNTELRLQFGEANLYLFKGPIGLLGFHDIARVWMDSELSDKWHSGYGAGIWLAPFNKVVVVGALTASAEEKMLPQVSFGFQF